MTQRSGENLALPDITRRDIALMSNERLAGLAERVLSLSAADRRQNAILYYEPVSKKAAEVHKSRKKVIGVGGGNGSSKTETCIVEIIALATGCFPTSIADDMAEKFKGPVKCRIVVESLTTVLHPIIIPKLQHWTWTGLKPEGGRQGHWGWVPKTCLIDGSWDKSWSEKLRRLRVLCRDPEDMDKVLGESSIQFMSHDQDPSDFASGDFDLIMHDEPPTFAIWRENRARAMRVDGTRYLAMTWPDDPAIPVDWLFDEVYEPAMRGDPDIDWIELWTTDNPHLNQGAVSRAAGEMSAAERAVRIKGQPIRFSNLIHPLFTDIDHEWCFTCGDVATRVDGVCLKCGSGEICDYNHVTDYRGSKSWPVVFVLDPHPRKPHMMAWAQIDPSDDVVIAAELQVDGDPTALKRAIEALEEARGFDVRQRLVDPNMARSPANARRREVTWQDEFDQAGLMCDLADNSDVGRARVNEYLKPDPITWRPRLFVHESCTMCIQQMKRYSWDDYRRNDDRDQKQTPRDKYDDYPAMLRYLMNSAPEFRMLMTGAPVLGKRRVA